ncbi:MAG: hypothetical protein RR994_02635, partial [Clostridia bacterium]
MNERRRAIREIRPDGTIEKTEYNNNGTVKKVTNPLGYRTFHAYNGMNLETDTRVEVSANNFAYTGIIYDGAGRIISEKQGIGYSTEVGVCTNYVTKTKSYYLDGNVKSEETVDGKKITYEYDLDGKPVKKDEYVDANSKITTSYINDYNGKPIQIRQNIDNIDLGTGTSGTTETTIVNTYDKDGNLLTSVNQEGTVTSNVYDKLGRVVRTQTSGTDEYGAPSPHVSWKTYDCMGKIAQFSDENGNLTINTYDARGNLIRKTQKNGSKEIVHAFEYDLKNRPVREVTPANYDTSKATLVGMNHTQYTYDNMNREIIKRYIYKASPTGGQTEQVVIASKYDEVGNKIKEVTGEGYAKSTGLNAVEKIENAYGTEYTYDGRGLQVTVRDAETKARNLPFTTKFIYDGLGRKVREKFASDPTIDYAYDANGNMLQKMVYGAADGYFEENNTFNRMGQKLTSKDAQNHASTYTYNSIGKLKRVVQPGDASIAENITTYVYDIMGRVKNKKDSRGHVIAYTYDRQSRVLSETSQNTSGTDKITATKAYDKVGNVRFKTDGNGNVSEYVFDSLNCNISLINTVGGKKHVTQQEYDKNGNPVSTRNWLGNTSATQYDALGRVVAKVDAYGKTMQKLAYNADNAQIKQYTLLPGGAYAETTFEYDKNGRLTRTTHPMGDTEQQSYD